MLQHVDQAGQKIIETGTRLQLHQGVACWIDTQRQAQILGGFFEVGAGRRQVEAVLRRGDAFELGITGKIGDLRGRNIFAEEQAGGFRQLVRLVEDDGIAGRQQLGHAFVLEHHVGKEQVVIDDHHVGRQRLAAGGENKAFLVIRAILAEAVVAGGRHHAPHRRTLRHVAAFAFIASLRFPGKAGDGASVPGILFREESAVGNGALQVVMADVIGPPLEQRRFHRHVEGSANGRQIAVEELVLQVLGTGGNDHLAAGHQRRNKIGVGLAGSGTGFGDKHPVFLKRCSNSFGHFKLLIAQAIAADAASQGASRGKDIGKRGKHAGGREDHIEARGRIVPEAGTESLQDNGSHTGRS